MLLSAEIRRKHPDLKLYSVLLQYLRPEAGVCNSEVQRGCCDFSRAGVRDHVFHLRRTGKRATAEGSRGEAAS